MHIAHCTIDLKASWICCITLVLCTSALWSSCNIAIAVCSAHCSIVFAMEWCAPTTSTLQSAVLRNIIGHSIPLLLLHSHCFSDGMWNEYKPELNLVPSKLWSPKVACVRNTKAALECSIYRRISAFVAFKCIAPLIGEIVRGQFPWERLFGGRAGQSRLEEHMHLLFSKRRPTEQDELETEVLGPKSLFRGLF